MSAITGEYARAYYHITGALTDSAPACTASGTTDTLCIFDTEPQCGQRMASPLAAFLQIFLSSR